MKLPPDTRHVYERLIADLTNRPDYAPIGMNLDESVSVRRIELHLLVDAMRQLVGTDDFSADEANIDHELSVLDVRQGDIVLVYCANEESYRKFGRLIAWSELGRRCFYVPLPEGLRLEALDEEHGRRLWRMLGQRFGSTPR